MVGNLYKIVVVVVGVVDVVVTLPVQLCGGMEGSGSGSLWMM